MNSYQILEKLISFKSNSDDLPEGKSIGDVRVPSRIAPQQIDQSKLIPLMVATIQELEARIAVLES